ncbi:hypothetical protein [Novipirellula caenicola]|uniref:Uncharacterized protein n=1 Tax=Novipirellula caenicola TaxID=1536901 RepID=A0ABP9VR05_9BACT
MLLWKTSPSAIDSDEIARLPKQKVRAAPRNVSKVSWTVKPSFVTDTESGDYQRIGDDEARYIFKMVLMMLLILVLPAALMLLYLLFHSEAFHYDLTRNQVPVSWLPRK